jgi:ApbE superfamily uncharacterized protein (UPF0280 family)
MSAERTRLDGGRWHFQHGPIDLVLAADGCDAAVELAWMRFRTILDELVAELPALRRPVNAGPPVAGEVARRMAAACLAHAERFITPMAAVAGAVADEVVHAMRPAGPRRAYANNGGDIALHLEPGQRWRIGLVADVSRHGHEVALDGAFEVDAALPVRGVATSGWRGRSLSLGIADSVTVLAGTAADADAAATMIANEVHADHPAIVRARACDVADDTDLGERLVTRGVGTLPRELVDAALERGAAHAAALHARGIIWAAALVLQSRARVVGGLAPACAAGRLPGYSLYCRDTLPQYDGTHTGRAGP